MKLNYFTLLLCASWALGGCGSIAGDWQSREKLANGERNELEVNDDGSAELNMYVGLTADPALTKMKFNGDWSEDEDFEFDLECSKGCPDGVDLDFKLNCTLVSEVQFDCTSAAPFADYGYFEFEPEPVE